MTPLFIPLKSVYYNAFASGDKTNEYRLYGKRWNEHTCPPGRPVTLSRGYGKHNRMNGHVRDFLRVSLAALPEHVQESLRLLYGERAEREDIAVIGIDVEREQ